MDILIRLTNEEKALVTDYAEKHSISVSEAFKKALFEKIEDEYDEIIGDDAYSEYKKSGEKSNPVSKLWEELDL